MIKGITALIIASAGLWLAPAAAAQFEIDPDHFDIPATAVVQPRPKQFKKPMRISLQQKQVQRHRVQGSKGTRNPETTRRAFSTAAAAQPGRVSGATRKVLNARQDPRDVIADPHARYFGAELSERALNPGDGAQLGETRFADWLKSPASQPPKAKSPSAAAATATKRD